VNIAATIAKMKAAGMTAEAIVLALECFVESETERNVARNSVTDVTPAAARMRRMRERKANENNVLDAEKAASVEVSERIEGVTERNNSVTSYNTLSSLETALEEEKKETIVRSVTKKRNSYTAAFETFWAAFPTDAGMSKLEASKAWDKLSPEDQQAATASIPAFKVWVAQQGQTYRVVHAVRFLSQRRFDGFKPAVESTEAVSTRVYVKSGTDAFDAWDAFYKRTKGKLAPRDQRGGWYFETEYPQQEQAA
jgi:hypothetical protein